MGPPWGGCPPQTKTAVELECWKKLTRECWKWLSWKCQVKENLLAMMKYRERWNLRSWRKVTPPRMGGWGRGWGSGWGRTRPPPILRSEGTTLKNETNNQSDISKQNSDAESLLKIKCENDPEKPRQIIDPITTINPKIKINAWGYSFVHEVSMVLTRPNAQGIKEQFSHENEK